MIPLLNNSTLSEGIRYPSTKKLPMVKGRGRGKLRDFTEGFLPRENEMEKENKEK